MTSRTPRVRPDVVFRRLADDEWALFDPATNQVHALNLSAAIVWEHADGSRSTDGIVAEVRQAYDEEPPGLDADVQSILERFAEEGLIDWT